ncbi:hypothetical protein J2T41_002616 [Pseudomonas citronellolis]|uniref:hypothetical protein n=1 Tax=Pseudomonas citronellolis TaxID=53408 RepID=UPI00209E5EA3|nr:hypothetical protein [Pseudomonas citronellolis]MCP1642997.1 hypothetical protein [Pseudomonas citronellolis]MCP1665871.1 hypothetical protein [Pseudomonas citronellolis]MCP1696780.1 hypothetical protein [Pseudomonas citronellolis]MCP1703478.1 hypothetical protein [Pseudomonas citronellolis]MCP1797612.1 hypothetical protein [Pseudomonas citronellolis]
MSKVKRDDNYGYLNFFNIDLSGLYRVQRRNTEDDIVSESLGLSTLEVLRGIKSWVKGRGLRETCPWSNIGKSGDDPVMCYCREVKELENGDFFIPLWKHDPSDTKGFRGLELDDNGKPTGNYINNNASQTDDRYVWGHPCYYWIIPSENLVVSIKFEDSKCDSDLMKKWITYCVRYRLKFQGYNRRQAGDAETRIQFSSPFSPESYNLIYKFATSLREFKTSEKRLEKICATTKHMLLRNEVVVSPDAAEIEMKSALEKKKGLNKANVEVFDFLQSFIAKFFSDPTNDEDNIHRVEIKLEATPTVDQLKELMEYSSDFPEDGWPDVIFINENGDKTSIKKHRIVERIMLNKVIDAYSCDTIYNAVKENRSYYIQVSKLSSSDNNEEKDLLPSEAEG